MDAPNGMQVDHINNNPLDNRVSNLRIVTQHQNMQNLKGARRDSYSGVRGVSWDKKSRKWRVRVKVNHIWHHIGLFEDIEIAKVAVKQARARLMPYSKEAAAE